MALKVAHAKKIEHGSLKRPDLMQPKRIDISQTKKLFKDFGIDVEIPEFDTRGELWIWRERLIRKYT